MTDDVKSPGRATTVQDQGRPAATIGEGIPQSGSMDQYSGRTRQVPCGNHRQGSPGPRYGT